MAIFIVDDLDVKKYEYLIVLFLWTVLEFWEFIIRIKEQTLIIKNKQKKKNKQTTKLKSETESIKNNHNFK